MAVAAVYHADRYRGIGELVRPARIGKHGAGTTCFVSRAGARSFGMPKISQRTTANRTAPSVPANRYRAAVGVEPLCLRIPGACEFVGISRSKLYELIASGEIETVKLGSATLVLTASLRALIEALRVPNPGCPSGAGESLPLPPGLTSPAAPFCGGARNAPRVKVRPVRP